MSAKRLLCWLGFHEFHRVRQFGGPITQAGIHVYSQPTCWYCGKTQSTNKEGK